MMKVIPDLDEARKTEPTMALSKAAKKIRVRTGTLRRHLAREDKVRREKIKGLRVPVRLDDLARLTEDYADLVHFEQIGPMLGVGNTMTRKLREAGKLPIWVQGEKVSEKHHDLFRRKDISHWADGLVGEPRELDALPEGCITLGNAPVKTKVPIGVLVDAIKDGKIEVIGRLRDKPKFGAAIIRRADAVAVRPEDITRRLGERRSGPRGPYRKRKKEEG